MFFRSWAGLVLLGVCAPLLAHAQAELRGRVVSDSGAPIAGATITLTSVRYSIRTDSAGAFVLSGTPGSTLMFSIRAPGFRDVTGSVTLPRRAGVSREFTLISEATELPEANPSDRVVRGRVTDTEGEPISYASVQVNGGSRFISDDSGRFTMPSPDGPFKLLVRRIGFSPAELTVEGTPDTAIRVRMSALATTLPQQRITGRAAFVSLDLNGFYRRMQDAERGATHGYFFTPEDFDFRKPNLVTQMVEGTPAVYIKRDPSGNPRKYQLMGAPCKPRELPGGPPDRSCQLAIGDANPNTPKLYRCVMTVYLDRVRIVGRTGATTDDFINDMVLPNSIAAMEVYPRGTGAPPEYQPMNGNCGVVLIWSK